MDAQEYSAQVEDLEKKLDRLRALYEQYFMGIERLEPSIMRHDVEKRFRLLRKERCSNTAVRFRFQTLIQRHTTLMAHWQKVCRAIEEGTYEPHIQRAQRLLAKQTAAGEPPPPEAGKRASAKTAPLVIDVDVEDVELEEPEAAVPAPAAPAAAPPAAAAPATASPSEPVTRVRTLDALRALLMDTSELAARIELPDSSPTVPAGAARPAGVARAATAAPPSKRAVVPQAPAMRRLPTEDRAEAIRAAFAAAASRAPSAVKVPSAEAIRKSLEKETERLSRKHPGQKVEFRVDVKDGKPLIKSFVLPPGKT